MKNTVKILFLLALACCSNLAFGQTENVPQQLFPYPTIPDSISDINKRYDYFVAHFWDRADMKRIFSSKKRFADAFEDYLTPLRYATADTVFSSVKRFMTSLEKQPKDQYYIGEIAEELLYGDSALYVSDELYVAFLKPILRNKRIDRNLKARFESQFIRLNNTLVNHPIVGIPYVTAEGENQMLEPRPGVPVIIFLSDPDCMDCRMAGTRLKADGRTTELIDEGAIDVVVLSAVEGDDAQWLEYAKSFPEKWKVGTNPQLDTIIDMRAGTPAFYLLDENGRIALKNTNIDVVISVMNRL
ncbi:MAG: DUF5106 domain-containing protein [Muribaculaceae bacterium]|nr:DUF5106 domain-containing protein [Muribaculaceae bacterium]